MSRRTIPYVLLGVLTAGAGLGAALGLTRGPNTVDPPATFHAAFAICDHRFLSRQLYIKPGPKAVEKRESADILDRQFRGLTECLQGDGYGTHGWVAYAPTPIPR